jgi:hypothetical protein
MMCSGKLDFSANPLNVVLTGPHASKRMAVGALGYRRAAIRPMIQEIKRLYEKPARQWRALAERAEKELQ